MKSKIIKLMFLITTYLIKQEVRIQTQKVWVGNSHFKIMQIIEDNKTRLNSISDLIKVIILQIIIIYNFLKNSVWKWYICVWQTKFMPHNYDTKLYNLYTQVVYSVFRRKGFILFPEGNSGKPHDFSGYFYVNKSLYSL